MRKVEFDLKGHPKKCICIACGTARRMIEIIRED